MFLITATPTHPRLDLSLLLQPPTPGVETAVSGNLKGPRDSRTSDAYVTYMPRIKDSPSEKTKGDSCHRETPPRATSLQNPLQAPSSHEGNGGTP